MDGNKGVTPEPVQTKKEANAGGDGRGQALEGFELGRFIAVLYRQSRWFMDRKMMPLDIGSGQHGILMFLYRHDGLSQDDISRAMDLDKATTARSVAKLEQAGYVTRVPDKQDRRINRVCITEKARDMQADIRGFSHEWRHILTEGMDEQEINVLQKAFAKLMNNASDFRSNACGKEPGES